MADNQAQDTQGQVAQPDQASMPEVTVTAPREYPKPTQEDLAWLNEKPERWVAFEKNFGSLPDGWSATSPKTSMTQPTPTQEDLDWLKADPKRADAFKKAFGKMPDGYGSPESSWADVGRAASTTIGAGEERIAAAAQEKGGVGSMISGGITGILDKATGANAQDVSSPYAQAKIRLNQSQYIPEALEWAAKNHAPIADDPLIQQAAAHVGMRPDQFVRDWQQYAGKTDKERRDFQDQQRGIMQDEQAKMREGAHRRELAGQVEKDYAPNTGNSKAKQIAFDVAVQSPELLGMAALSAIPIVNLSVPALMATDFGARAYSSGKDAGLDDKGAAAYALLSGTAATVPGVPVSRMASGEGSLVLQTAIKKFMSNGVARRFTGDVADQSLAMGIQNALQAGIDKGYIDPNMSLKDALDRMASGLKSGALMGGAFSAFHMGMAKAGGRPVTPADLQDRQKHDELMAEDAEAKKDDAEGSAKGSAKPDEEAEPRSAVRDANVSALQRLVAGEQLSDTEKDTLVKSGLAQVGGKTGRVVPSPEGRRLMTEAAREPKPQEGQPTEPTKATSDSSGAPQGELSLAEKPKQPELALEDDTKRSPSAAFDKVETEKRQRQAADEDRAYADRDAREAKAKDQDYPAAKNQAAEETIDQAPHSEKDPGSYLSIKDAMDVTKQRAADIAAQIPRMDGLSPEEREIENKLIDKIAANPQAAIDEYNRLPDTMGGKVISTDEARHLSEEYAANPNLSQSVHEPASWFANMLFKRALAQPPKPGEDNLVTFTAGGTGSGKSSTLLDAGPLVRKSQLIFDTVLNGKNTAEDKIQAALDAGKWVSIAYVYRGVKEAFENGTLFRANLNGRVVPAQVHLDTHSGAPEALWHLMDKFRDDPRVAFVGIDNTGGDGNAKLSDIESLLQRNHDEHATFGQLRDIGKRMLADGKITPEIYERTFGERPPASAHGEDVRDGARDGRQAESEHRGSEGAGAGSGDKERPALSEREKAKLAREEQRARRQLAKERIERRAAAGRASETYERLGKALTKIVDSWMEDQSHDLKGNRPFSMHEVLDSIIDQIKAGKGVGIDPKLTAAIVALRNYVGDVNVHFVEKITDPITSRVYDDLYGMFDSHSNSIQVRGNLADRANMIRTLLHEGYHAATFKEIERNPKGPLAQKLATLLVEARKAAALRYGAQTIADHIDYYSKWEKNMPKPEGGLINDFYGFTNLHEFVAEAFTNARFQSLLDEVTPPGRMNAEWAKPQGFFKKFVQILRDWLSAKGTGINTSLLEDVISVGGQIMHAQQLRAAQEQRAPITSNAARTMLAKRGEDGKDNGEDIARDIAAGRMTKLVVAAAEIGATKLIRGLVRFADWADSMIQELGEGIKPQLESLYQLARDKVSDINNIVYKTRDDGSLVGGPTPDFTKADIKPLRAQLLRLAREGAFGKDWYRYSTQALLEAVGGSKAKARQLAGLFSIYSSGNAVDSNTTMAIRAWHQWEAGQAISAGKPEQDEIAVRWLETGIEPTGMKRSNFYGNLIEALDGDDQRMFGGGVTVDRWMMRALGFLKEAPTDAQYAFVADQIRQVAKKLKWDNQQVQAAVWVAIKARWENVYDDVKAEGLKKGWIKETHSVSKGKQIKVVDPERYYGRMLDKALETALPKGAIEDAARNFADSLQRHRVQISWEAMPGANTDRLKGAHMVPVAALEAFQRDISAAHINPASGMDHLQEALGLLHAGHMQGNSAWFRDPGQVLQFRHWGPEGLTQLDPDRQGTGAAGTLAERNRSNKVISLYPYEYGPGQPEEHVKAGRHEYVVEVPAEHMYDASRDPRGYKLAAEEPTNPYDPTQTAYNHDAFETLVREAGFKGYYVSDRIGEIQDGQARMFEPVTAHPVETYAGRSTPPEMYAKAGAQEILYAPPEKNQSRKNGPQPHLLDPHAKLAIESYAAALGLANNQDAVGWHRPRFTGVRVKDSNGADIRVRNVSRDDILRAYKAVYDGLWADGLSEARRAEFAPIETPDGIRFINWGAMDNARFHEVVKDAMDQVFGDRHAYSKFAADGGLVNAADYERVLRDNGHWDRVKPALDAIRGRVEPVYREFAQRYGLSDPSRSSAGKESHKAEASSPVSVDRLTTGKGLYENVMTRFGALDHPDANLKFYPLQPEHAKAGEELAKRMGFDTKVFSYESDPSKGVEFQLPQLGKRGYQGGTLWIYDPRIEHGSFHDAEYTRAWRISHELGHAITEAFMQQRYGDSRRYGALGRETQQTRGALGKQKQVPVRGLTLAEAQRAVEWEDVAFRAQKMILEKMGVPISDADFAREYNVNIADAMYRVLSGDFGDPVSRSFMPSDKLPDVKAVLTALEGTELGLAKAQGREPTEGFDLKRWAPVSDDDIRRSLEAREAGGTQTKFSVRNEDYDYRVRVSDSQGEVAGDHEGLQFANRDDAMEHIQRMAEDRGAQIGGRTSHEELWSSTRAKGGKSDRTFSIEPVHRDPFKGQTADARSGTPSSRFMDEWREKYPEAGIGGPGDRIVNGNVLAGMVNDVTDTAGGTMYLTSLMSMEPGSGAGTKAMRDIIGMADKHGVVVELNASAFGQNPKALTQKQLTDWYQRVGFKPVAKNDFSLMRREPVPGSGQVPKFSTNAGKGISEAEAQRVIDHAQRMFPHAQHHLVDSIEDAPHEVQAQAAAQGVTERVEAAITHDYDGTHVYLIRQNARSVESALQTMVEEHVGHEGISKTFGSGMKAILDGFLRNMDVRAKIARAAKQWGLPVNHADPTVRKEAWRAAAEEWLAHVASKDMHTNLERGKLLEAVTTLKFALTKLGVPLKLSEADAHSALARAHQYVTNGRWMDNVIAQKEQEERDRVGPLQVAPREGEYIPRGEMPGVGDVGENVIRGFREIGDQMEQSMGKDRFARFAQLVEMRDRAKDLAIMRSNAERGTQPMSPEDAAESRTHPSVAEVQAMIDREGPWGEDDDGGGQKQLPKFSVVPPSGNADLDELLNDKIGATPTGWRTRLSHMMQDWRAKRVVMNLDRLYRLKQYEDDMKIPAAESGYISQRLATSVAPLLRVTMEWGGLKWTSTKGFDADKSMMPDYDEKVKPLNRILAPLHNDPAMLRRFEGYLAALRGKELLSQGRENLLEQRHVQAGLDLAKQYPHFVQMQREIAALNKNVLDFAEKAGVIDPESRKMWESDYYVPFYRIMDDAGAGPWGQGNLARVRNPIVRLTGGKENINDLTANIARNMATLINASVKAHAMRVAIDNLSQAGVAVRVPSLERGRDALVSTSEVNKLLQNAGITQKLSPSAIGGIQKLVSLTTPQGDDIVQVWRGGKREYYRVDDPLLMVGINAMKESQTKALGEFMRWSFRTPAMVFTKLTTENPAFGIRTLWKDNINAWTVGRGAMPVTPVVSAITGLAKAMGASESFRRMSAAGATFNAGRADPYDTNLSVKRYMTKQSIAGQLWDGYRDMMLSGENASRVTIYERTMAETGSHKLAAYEARDLMDYAMRGASPVIQFFVETVPFWGAHLQGMYKTARATAGGDVIGSVAKQVTTRAIKYTILSLAASALYMSNRRRDDYNDLPPIQKELYYHLYLPGNLHIKIPKAFESGTLFGTVPEAITETMMSKFDPQTVKEQTEYVMHAFLSALNLAPIPMVAKPVLESFANQDIATGYPILSEHDQGVLPSEQYGPRTSPLMTAVARQVPESKMTTWLQSPKQLQHLVMGYTGLMGLYALNAADYGFRLLTGMPAPANRNLGQVPVVGSFVTRTDEPATSTRSLGALSDVMIASNQLQKSIHDLETKGDPDSLARAQKYQQDKLDLVIAGAAMKPASDAIRELRNAQQLVQNDPDLTPEAKKKQLNEIQDAINKTARDVYEYRPGGKMNREILEQITPKATPQAKANVLKKNDMPALASIALQYGNTKMPARVQAAIEGLS